LAQALKSVANEAPTVEDSGDPLGVLRLPLLQLRLDWWREPGHRKDPWDKTPFKLWAGQQTSASIYSTLRTTVADAIADDRIPFDRPFAFHLPLTSRFGFDPGAAWNALDAGFSPNDQRYEVSSSPVVELLAAVGIQRFRPIPVNDDRDAFEYIAWSHPLPACVAVAVASGCVTDPSARRFRFRITSLGSYGCFTTATEIVR
jgi:CRISPR-associated protein Csx14